jgi:hypothetical protein
MRYKGKKPTNSYDHYKLTDLGVKSSKPDHIRNVLRQGIHDVFLEGKPQKAAPEMVVTGQTDTTRGKLNLGVAKIEKERTIYKKPKDQIEAESQDHFQE